MEGMGLIAKSVDVFGLTVTQTLFTAYFTTGLFLILVLIYYISQKYLPNNKLVMSVELGIEKLQDFVDSVGIGLPVFARVLATFIFVYIFFNNIVGVVGDLFSSIPSVHHYFRPVTSDAYLNAIMAVFCVVAAFIYGLKHGGWHFIQKYVPIKGIGIIKEIDVWWKYILKGFDIILGLFVGMIELLGEFARMLSLSLRLAGNIFAGMMLLGLGITGASLLFKTVLPWDVPLILPLLPFFVELFVGFLQAFIFTLLVLVYFKMAGESH